MLIVELIYKQSLDKLDEHLQEHRAFLQKYYDQGVLIMSGPKEPRTGGVIIALADRLTMSEIIKEDPFYIHQLADYHMTEFKPVKCCEQLKKILKVS